MQSKIWQYGYKKKIKSGTYFANLSQWDYWIFSIGRGKPMQEASVLVQKGGGNIGPPGSRAVGRRA
jgi:hypothetical protein